MTQADDHWLPADGAPAPDRDEQGGAFLTPEHRARLEAWLRAHPFPRGREIGAVDPAGYQLEHIRRALPPGWRVLADPIWEIVQRHDVLTRQVKEKFAGLRVYVSSQADGRGDVAAAELALGALEARAARLCQVCGAPGTRRVNPRGWWATLCDTHARPFEAGTPLRDLYRPSDTEDHE